MQLPVVTEVSKLFAMGIQEKMRLKKMPKE